MRWTIPNILSALRLIGAPLLLVLAAAQRPTAFLVLAIVLCIDDWLDGKLAIWLKQQTTFGARLDSAADAAFYAALLLGVAWLERPFLLRQAVWIAAALLSYGLTTAAGLIKYGRVPSYHTRGAKISWLLVMFSVVMIFLATDRAAWPLRVAMLVVTATNLEATLITCLLPTWRADVPSLLHALRLRRDEQRIAG